MEEKIKEIKEIGRLSEEIAKGIKECDLCIFVKDGKVNVIEKGNIVKGVIRVEFTAGIGEVSEIILQKRVI